MCEYVNVIFDSFDSNSCIVWESSTKIANIIWINELFLCYFVFTFKSTYKRLELFLFFFSFLFSCVYYSFCSSLLFCFFFYVCFLFCFILLFVELCCGVTLFQPIVSHKTCFSLLSKNLYRLIILWISQFSYVYIRCLSEAKLGMMNLLTDQLRCFTKEEFIFRRRAYNFAFYNQPHSYELIYWLCTF